KRKYIKDRSQLGLFKNDQNFKRSVESAIEKYQQIKRNESKVLGDIGEKKQWLDEINEVLKPYKRICDFHIGIYFGNDISENEYNERIVSFTTDFYWDVTNYFHWEIEFPEVMLTKNGFDCIVANPPYIGFKAADPNARPFFSDAYSDVYNGKADIYYFFLFQSLRNINHEGKIGYITTRYWLEAESAFLLRQYIDNKEIGHQILDFSDFSVFEGVGTKCAINFFNDSVSSVIYNCYRDGSKSKLINNLNETSIKKFFSEKSIKRTSNNKWQFFNSCENSLVNKILEQTIEAGKIGSTKQGVVTGKDAAFVYTKETIEKNNIETNHLKKWLKIGDILPFVHRQRQELFLNYLNDRDNINDLTFTVKYLERFKSGLLNRRECKAGKIKYFHLQWGRKKDFFENPKLIARKVSPINCFIADFNKYYSSADTTLFIPNNSSEFVIYFLLGYLNSNISTFIFRSYAKKMDYRYEYYPTPVAQILVPQFLANRDELSEAIKNYNENGSNIETRIATLSKEISNTDYKTEQYEKNIRQINLLANQFFEITFEEEKLLTDISKYRWDK
ncbi:MAG: Eco57I restriction-modification methylase domain-containing protein, partial [Candidatus Pacebacteria bacterium]|nr:Eco57I restriction-modification methylase domain-containing protein [Candidatus Paceibacterota bacterium]